VGSKADCAEMSASTELHLGIFIFLHILYPGISTHQHTRTHTQQASNDQQESDIVQGQVGLSYRTVSADRVANAFGAIPVIRLWLSTLRAGDQ
jgi:hypothetical protein